MALRVQWLDELGAEGMSSDEEVDAPSGKKYYILAPQWRSPSLVPWLRVFDSLYIRYLNRPDRQDRRGCMPRQRYASGRLSTSRMFVPGLPVNAYREDWLKDHPDPRNDVHPTEERIYSHDPQLAECVLVSVPYASLLMSLTFFQDWL